MSPLIEEYWDKLLPNGLFTELQGLGFAWGKVAASYGEAVDWFSERDVSVSVDEENGKWHIRAWRTSDKDDLCIEKHNTTRESEAMRELIWRAACVYRIIYYDDYHFNYD